MKLIDDFLNGITMYRLMLYFLMAVVAMAAAASFLGILLFSELAILFSAIFLVVICLGTNAVFAKLFGAIRNVESVYITALILALIITPTTNLQGLVFLFSAAVLAMAGKYVVAFRAKHLFNPAALAVFLTSVFFGQSASWWIGNPAMLIPIVLGGLLIVRKIQREDLVLSFLAASVATATGLALVRGSDLMSTLEQLVLYSPLFFFAFVMLVEPLTTPAKKFWRIFYGVLVGFLFSFPVRLGQFYVTPEAALLMGNFFSFLVGFKGRLNLELVEKTKIAPDIYDFVFKANRKISYAPGQYMEWSLEHAHPDSRGTRRFFTLASSPTEKNIRIGIKFNQKSSSFKNKLLSLTSSDQLCASQLAGDFTLPEDMDKKLVFVAGGIGITPFRSMLKYLLETGQRRSIILFFANKTAADIVYRDVLDEAQRRLGVRVIYTLTDKENAPAGWKGETGRISGDMIKRNVPDFSERIFYLSGPRSLVRAYEEVLKNMGVSRGQIKVDYFAGYA